MSGTPNMPSPAELATFARAIGWDHVAADRRKSKGGIVTPGSWTSDDIKDILAHWLLWDAAIKDAGDGFAAADEILSAPRVGIEDVMQQLGTANKSTLKKWFIASRARCYGGVDGVDLAERDWGRIIVEQSFTKESVHTMRRERDSLKTSRASAGGAARHQNAVNSAKKKK